MNILEQNFLKEVQRAIEEKKFIFTKDTWSRVQNNRREVMDILEQSFPNEDWFDRRISGLPVWEYVNNLNNAYYCRKSSTGANKFRTTVIQNQKGEFCALCGEVERNINGKKNLQVDHIKRVNDGGKDEINNLHLLCHACHSGKTNLENESLGYLLKLKDNDETIDNSLRYYILLKKSVKIEGKRFGKCRCGKVVPECKIQITPPLQNMIYSILNFKQNCNFCK